MPRPIWSGSLAFGLVNIPVKLYSATQSETLDFDLLRKEDLSPIRYLRVARADGKEVEYDDLVRGYQYRKGDYVILTTEDFKKADVRKSKSIDILDFVNEDEIDAIYFEKPYYLAPDKGAEKPYALMIDALTRSKKIGVAKFVMRTRERLGVVKPFQNALVLDQIRFQNEIKPIYDLNLPENVKVDNREIEMALALINQLSAHFEPDEYHDEYNEELKEIIDQKAKGETIRPRGEEPQPTEVKNLMDTLKKSLEQAQKK
jgi:DNA end-binding protein Ku